MVNLIITVISIALITIVAFMSLPYFSERTLLGSGYDAQIRAATSNLVTHISQFDLDKTTATQSPADMATAAGITLPVDTAPERALMHDAANVYFDLNSATLPVIRDFRNWRTAYNAYAVGADPDAIWALCFSGTISEPYYDALLEVFEDSALNTRATVVQSCATLNKPTTYSANVGILFPVKGNINEAQKPYFTSTPPNSVTSGTTLTYNIATTSVQAGLQRTISFVDDWTPPAGMTLGAVNPAAGTATLTWVVPAITPTFPAGLYTIRLKVTDNHPDLRTGLQIANISVRSP